LMPIRQVALENPLPSALYIYRVDGQNRVLTPTPQGAPLVKDLSLGLTTHYVADITNFVNSQLQIDATNSNALLILLDDRQYRSSVNRLYIGDSRNQYSMKFKLYYVTLSN
jgi:hypothetical protein